MTQAIAYHILNGDCLFKQFPEEIQGEQIIMRECLADGPVYPDFGDLFYEIRSDFIQSAYSAGDQEYKISSVPEINKIRQLSGGARIYLWFEDDLFCLVNLIAIIHNLKNADLQLHVVRALTLTYGFSGMNTHELNLAYSNSRILSKPEIQAFSKLWEAYCHNDEINILQQSKLLISNGLVLKEALECHINRISKEPNKHNPKAILSQLIIELGTKNFNLLFSAFHKRYPIYGFGDLQFKRIYQAIIQNNK